jgi:hypothetical protein
MFKTLLCYIKYLWLVLKHKYFVIVAGLRLGAPLHLLLLHDLSKLSPAEFTHYARRVYGCKEYTDGFKRAWLHHQNSNPHHWEYWIQRSPHDREVNSDMLVDIPDKYILEMMADWMGASRAYNGKWPTPGNWKWLYDPKSSFYEMRVTYTSYMKIREYLEEMGFEVPKNQNDPE